MSGGGRGSGVKHSIIRLVELRAKIGVLQGKHNIRWIQQDNQVLREVGHCVYQEILTGQQNGTGLGYAEAAAYYRQVDVGQLGRRVMRVRSRLPEYSGTAEATTMAFFSFTSEAIVPSGRASPPHGDEVPGKECDAITAVCQVKCRQDGKRPLARGPVGRHRAQNGISRGHVSSVPAFVRSNHWWKVSGGGSGMSRPRRVQLLSELPTTNVGSTLKTPSATAIASRNSFGRDRTTAAAFISPSLP